MTIIIFLVILATLILAHESGHFLAAKFFNVRVDEFGFGFPPRLLGGRYGETEYSLNLIPFGGFVKIFGETPAEEEALTAAEKKRNLIYQPKKNQAVILAAGIIFNVLLAWLLISLGFLIGMPLPADQAALFPNHSSAKLLITEILPDSPAAQAGLKTGDEIVSLNRTVPQSVSEVQELIAASSEKPISFSYRHGRVFTTPAPAIQELKITPRAGIIGETPGIGIGLDKIMIARASFFSALEQGAKLTAKLTFLTAKALGNLLLDIFRGRGDLAGIAGPVGLVGLVGNAEQLGFVYLLSFTALISINLAIVNLLPFPALDGGRLLFLLIEKLKGSPIKPKIANTFNLVGFVLLLTLMAVITIHDVFRLFN